MRESVSAVFISSKNETCFSMVRQDYLSVFPGYTSFPGGKIDKSDSVSPQAVPEKFSSVMSDIHWHALDREMSEELNFSLISNISLIEKISLLGTAVTPEFNPYRFKSFFYVITLKEEVHFDVDEGETKTSIWSSPKELLAQYERGEMLAVPPTVSMIKTLASDIHAQGPIDFKLETIEAREVPMIESVRGMKQFMPLSNTFPPANRTNCFLIGDEVKVLIDPSPKDDDEFEKFCRTIDRYGFNEIFISHHHRDHYERLDHMVAKYQCPVKMSRVTYDFICEDKGADYLAGMDIQFLKEGDILTQSLGEDILVYEVPGHDEGQLALAPKSLNWFFVGDLIQTIGTVVIGGKEGHMGKYFKSLQRIIDLAPKACFPSHGIALGGTKKLEKTLKHRKLREEQVLKLYNEGKKTEEILAIVYEGLEDKLLPYARKTIEAHIQHIKEYQS